MMLSKKIGTSNNKTLEYINGLALCVSISVLLFGYFLQFPNASRHSSLAVKNIILKHEICVILCLGELQEMPSHGYFPLYFGCPRED